MTKERDLQCSIVTHTSLSKELLTPTKTPQKAERNAQRFIRLVLRGWQVTTIDELPEAARKSLMQQVEWNRNRFDITLSLPRARN